MGFRWPLFQKRKSLRNFIIFLIESKTIVTKKKIKFGFEFEFEIKFVLFTQTLFFKLRIIKYDLVKYMHFYPKDNLNAFVNCVCVVYFIIIIMVIFFLFNAI